MEKRYGTSACSSLVVWPHLSAGEAGKCSPPSGQALSHLPTYVCAKSLQLCLTLCGPWSVAQQVLLSIRFSRQEYWSRLPCPPPRDLPNPGIEPISLTSPALAGGFFTPSTTWEALPVSICGEFSSLFVVLKEKHIRIGVRIKAFDSNPGLVRT